jgi:hypothetical protein
MLNTNATATDRRSQVHTEVRRPFEAVLERVVWFVFGVIEVLIGVRFVLLLLGANAETAFVRGVYGLSNIFMVPFVAVFRTQHVASGAVFEWSALVAIAVYALVAWGLVALIHAVGPRTNSQTVERVVKDDDGEAR